MSLDASHSDLLIRVDSRDQEIGFESKARCHDGEGLLHRAFSVFIFDTAGRVLLQQRSSKKRLWPLFWSNSCCSHPRRGETVESAAARRLQEELSVTAPLTVLYKFEYHARFGEAGSERELCWVLVGRSRGIAKADPAEIAALRFVAPDELDHELEAHPELYTPWLHLEWPRLRRDHAGAL